MFGDLDPGDLYTIEMSVESEGANPVYRNYTFADSTFPVPPVISAIGNVTSNSIDFIWDQPEGFHKVKILFIFHPDTSCCQVVSAKNGLKYMVCFERCEILQQRLYSALNDNYKNKFGIMLFLIIT